MSKSAYNFTIFNVYDPVGAVGKNKIIVMRYYKQSLAVFGCYLFEQVQPPDSAPTFQMLVLG